MPTSTHDDQASYFKAAVMRNTIEFWSALLALALMTVEGCAAKTVTVSRSGQLTNHTEQNQAALVLGTAVVKFGLEEHGDWIFQRTAGAATTLRVWSEPEEISINVYLDMDKPDGSTTRARWRLEATGTDLGRERTAVDHLAKLIYDFDHSSI